MTDQERMFPVLRAPSWKPRGKLCPKSIPWSAVAPYEDQAKKNHGGQTLAVLASRGGLSPLELWHIFRRERWPTDGHPDYLRACIDAEVFLQYLVSGGEIYDPARPDGEPTEC